MKLKNKATDQECDFSDKAQADEFLTNVEDPGNWETDGAEGEEAPAKAAKAKK